LADRFYRMAPWRWMHDSDLFGVANAAIGETGFCCVMGRLGEFYGMAVYRGEAGLESYESLLEIDSDQVPNLKAFEQNCLMLSFSSWDELMPQEQEYLSETDLPPLQKDLWPSFRDYSPGLMPWPIEQEAQAQYLALCIEQALDFCPEIAASPHVLEPPSPMKNGFLVRTPQATPSSWKNEWVEVETYSPPSRKPVLDTKLLRGELGLFPRKEEVWGVDVFYVPVPTQIAEERPFFPQILVIAQFNNGHIIGHEVIPYGKLLNRIQSTFTEVAQQQRHIPSRIIVRNYEVLEMLEGLASVLQISLELDEQNELLAEIKDTFFNSMI
ncbi:MAG: hypothetical protein AAF399_28155, partial [Bacteroidota bacterium]